MGRPTIKPLVERFWSKVAKEKTGCWNWTGKLNRGYGYIRNDGKWNYAHRISYVLEHGTIPDGLNILHKCDNPRCVNPSHLFAGSQLENVLDCKSKGRNAWVSHKGPDAPWAKLTTENVLAMREIRRSTGMSHKLIALRFGVSTMTAYRAVEGISWSNI